MPNFKIPKYVYVSTDFASLKLFQHIRTNSTISKHSFIVSTKRHSIFKLKICELLIKTIQPKLSRSSLIKFRLNFLATALQLFFLDFFSVFYLFLPLHSSTTLNTRQHGFRISVNAFTTKTTFRLVDFKKFSALQCWFRFASQSG